MLEYIIKIDKKYNLDPKKVVDGCKGHFLLKSRDHDYLGDYPTYEGTEGKYHKFLAPTEMAIGVLIVLHQVVCHGEKRERYYDTNLVLIA